MISSVELFFEDFSDDDEPKILLRHRRALRDKSNPLELPSQSFVANFRLSKEAFIFILEKIKNSLEPSCSSCAIQPILKLACALRFFGGGSYQQCVGNDYELGFSQPTVSVVLSEILNIFETTICTEWIKFEMSEEEKGEARRSFFTRAGFPGIIGCVDGTHIAIVSPVNLKHQYMNRKGFFSLNAMIACDHNMIIRYVDARFPGSTHDSFIWNCSELNDLLSRMHDNGESHSMYLADSGYPLRSYLMTPFRNAIPGSRESSYNKIHAKARNVIERAIGVLKSRFRCLLDRKLHYAPKKATQIVNACCALHNLCTHFKVPNIEEVPREDEVTNEDIIPMRELPSDNTTSLGESIRNEIMQSIT